MSQGTSKILSIDSDERTSLWIRDQLEKNGLECEIVSVVTGRDGFRIMNSRDFDLCVLEYALPDMTGVQLCALMRQMGSTVPMLFFTPMNRRVDRERADAAGAAGYLVKPEEAELFVDMVRHLLKRNGRIYAVPPKRLDLAQAA